MVKSRAAKVRDLFNLLKFESEGVVFLLQTKRETMTQIGRKMKEITPEWRSSQIRGNLRGLTNTKTGKFETFGYAGPGAKGRVASDYHRGIERDTTPTAKSITRR